MSHVVEINDIHELAGYRMVWNCLFQETLGASFFHTMDWLELYWKHFGQDQKLRVLVVYSGKRPIGIVPLCVRRERFKVGHLRVLTYPLHDWGTFYRPIGPNPAASLHVAMCHLHETHRDWDLLDLRWLDTDRHDRGRTQRAMQAAGFGAHASPWAVTAVVDLSGSWDDYVASRSAKWRANRRRDERLLAERGEVTLERYRPAGEAEGDGDPRWDLWQACQQVSRCSWQAQSQTGTTLTHRSVQPFLQEAHAVAAKKGMLDLCLLLVDRQPVAFNYRYHWDGTVFGLRMGYDPHFAREGCGNVLLARTVRDSYQRGDHRFDLGPGQLNYKCRYSTHLETCYHCTHFPVSSLRAQALGLKRWIKGTQGQGHDAA